MGESALVLDCRRGAPHVHMESGGVARSGKGGQDSRAHVSGMAKGREKHETKQHNSECVEQHGDEMLRTEQKHCSLNDKTGAAEVEEQRASIQELAIRETSKPRSRKKLGNEPDATTGRHDRQQTDRGASRST